MFFGGSDLLDPPLGFTQKCFPVEVVTLHQSNTPINSKLWSSLVPGGWKFDAKDITGLLEGLLFFFLNLNLPNLFLLLLLWYLLTCCSCCNNISCYFCDFREICELLEGSFISLNFFRAKIPEKFTSECNPRHKCSNLHCFFNFWANEKLIILMTYLDVYSLHIDIELDKKIQVGKAKKV